MDLTSSKRTWKVSLVAAVLAMAGFAANASAETFTTTQTEDVAIPTSGKANPYPSTLEVEEGDGRITDVNVSLTLSHTFPDDLEIAIVSPNGDAEVLMSDACGETDLSNATITFDNSAGTAVPDAGPCLSTSYQPTNIGAGDSWEAPGPGVVGTNQLGNFNGEDPNGSWELFVFDDAGPDEGTITSWSVTITTETAEIVIPGSGTSGKSKPYPATKSFDTAPGQVISDLNLNFSNFSHLFPDDVDALLVGPRRGANVMAMSDACGTEPIHLFQWNFDDEATPIMGTTIASCDPINIRPSNNGSGDTLPAPAPGGPYGSTMSVFDGLEGGQFQLFVNDDAGGDTGFLTKWGLTVTTRDAADTGFSASSTRVEEGGKALLEVKRTGEANLGPATLNVSTGGAAAVGADYTAPPATLEFARGEASKTIEVPIANDNVGEGTERFNVVLSSPRDDARLKGTTSTEVVIGPDNEIKFGKLKRNAKKGTAKLFVNVPGPGTLVMVGKQVKRVTMQVSQAGNVALPLKAKGNGLRKLAKAGDVKLTPKVTFTPIDGSALTASRKAKLVLND